MNHFLRRKELDILESKLNIWMKINLILILSLSFGLNVNAQTNDEVLLSRAARSYSNGAFSQVLDITKKISDSASNAVLFQKYRLKALSELAFAQNNAAIESVRHMLELNPTYKFNPITDPDELNVLLMKLRVIPKLNLGLSLSIGSNTTYAKATKVYTVARNSKSYSSQNTMIFSIDGGYNFSNRSGIGISIINAVKEYSVEYKVQDFRINLTERLNYIDFPIFYKFKLLEANKISMYAHLGGFVGYQYQSNNSINSINYTDNSSLEIRSFSADKRKMKWNAGGLFGASLQYNMRKGSVVLNCSYLNGLTNTVNANNRYTNPQLLHDYYYLDDDIQLNNLSIGLGYIININYQIERRKSKW